MLNKENKEKFLEDLKKVFEYGYIKGFDYVANVISLINDIEDVKKYLNDELVKYWIPAIVERLFGREAYKTCDLNKESKETFMLINPAFLQYEWSHFNNMAIDVIKNQNYCECESKSIDYSKELICYLYGGFKWFDSYVRILDEEKLIDKKTVVYFVKDEEVIVERMKKYKDEYRMVREKQIIKKVYPEMEYPGVIRPFHTPNKIENEVQLEILKRLSYKRI